MIDIHTTEEKLSIPSTEKNVEVSGTHSGENEYDQINEKYKK